MNKLRQMVEAGQQIPYQYKLSHMNQSFESWMNHRIAQREKASARNEKLKQMMENAPENSDFILFTVPGAKLTRDAELLIREQLVLHPEAVLVYGDEDLPQKQREAGLNYEQSECRISCKEYAPWLKPVWSPALFKSCFYFGNFFAIRKSAYEKWKETSSLRLEQVLQESNADEVERWIALQGWTPVEPDKEGNVFLRPGENESCFLEPEFVEDLKVRTQLRYRYRMCYEILMQNGAFDVNGRKKVRNIPEILIHDGSWLDMPRIFDIGGLTCQGLPADVLFPPMQTQTRDGEAVAEDLVSIVIPSKDHPETLERCLRSLREETELETIQMEVIVVDNGSNAANRLRLEKMAKLYDVHYIYQPMEFNFSRMCNLGAEKARGNFVLLLNDDIEIMQSNWLEELVKHARMPYAGAVGAKLLYPGTTKIQHAGITNIRLGPTHKLQQMDDRKVYYFGQNRMVHDMIGVTGACLLVRSDLYHRLGGLSEELRVAFNDVDFCFRIFEQGYSNIQCNDVVLYHHESLSRGNDLEDEAKTKRLKGEMDKLFERHPDLFAKDPYYSHYLTFDVSDVGFTYYFLSIEFNRNIQIAKPQKLQKLPEGVREDACLNCGVEYHDKLKGWIGDAEASDAGEDVYLQGYAFIIGSDNACYEWKILLQEDETGLLYQIPLKSQYRPDIAQNVPDQKNVELSGFAVRIPEGNLPSGNYRIGLYAKRKLAHEQIIWWTTCGFSV